MLPLMVMFGGSSFAAARLYERWGANPGMVLPGLRTGLF
jgi:hypothetical protein